MARGCGSGGGFRRAVSRTSVHPLVTVYHNHGLRVAPVDLEGRLEGGIGGGFVDAASLSYGQSRLGLVPR